MKHILVITTRDIPHIPIEEADRNDSMYKFIAADKLRMYVDSRSKENNMPMPPNIQTYLRTYGNETQNVKKDVKKNLEEYSNKNDCEIPILCRKVSDEFYIYVSLCLDKAYRGFADEICHGYLNAIIDDVQNDIHSDNMCIHLLAHSLDIVYEVCDPRALSRPVGLEEFKNSEIQKKLHTAHIFCHEESDKYYREIVGKISDANINSKILETLK